MENHREDTDSLLKCIQMSVGLVYISMILIQPTDIKECCAGNRIILTDIFSFAFYSLGNSENMQLMVHLDQGHLVKEDLLK